jgi:RNA recognition motif-containing protein
LNNKEAKKRLEANRELKLYLGGLPEELTEQDLHDYFSTFGELSNSYIIYDFDTKKSRGFGFVEYMNKADVLKVLDLDHVSKMKLKNDIKKEKEKNKKDKSYKGSRNGQGSEHNMSMRSGEFMPNPHGYPQPGYGHPGFNQNFAQPPPGMPSNQQGYYYGNNPG